MPPEGQSFPAGERLLERGLRAPEPALSLGRLRAGAIGGWALPGASVIFKYRPLSVSAWSCAPSKM